MALRLQVGQVQPAAGVHRHAVAYGGGPERLDGLFQDAVGLGEVSQPGRRHAVERPADQGLEVQELAVGAEGEAVGVNPRQ